MWVGVAGVALGAGSLCKRGSGVLETLAKAGASAKKEGSHGGLALVEDAGDLRGGEFIAGGEEKDVAFGFGKPLPLAEHGPEALCVCEGLIGGQGPGDEGLSEEVVHLLRADAAAAIEGKVPGNADEPDTEIADLLQGVAALEDAER